MRKEHFIHFPIECAAQNFGCVRRAAFVLHRGKRTLVVDPRNKSIAQRDIQTIKQTLSWAYIDNIIVVIRIPLDKRHKSKIEYTAMQRMLQKL